jgi:hypothetical protein
MVWQGGRHIGGEGLVVVIHDGRPLRPLQIDVKRCNREILLIIITLDRGEEMRLENAPSVSATGRNMEDLERWFLRFLTSGGGCRWRRLRGRRLRCFGQSPRQGTIALFAVCVNATPSNLHRPIHWATNSHPRCPRSPAFSRRHYCR